MPKLVRTLPANLSLETLPSATERFAGNAFCFSQYYEVSSSLNCRIRDIFASQHLAYSDSSCSNGGLLERSAGNNGRDRKAIERKRIISVANYGLRTPSNAFLVVLRPGERLVGSLLDDVRGALAASREVYWQFREVHWQKARGWLALVWRGLLAQRERCAGKDRDVRWQSYQHK